MDTDSFVFLQNKFFTMKSIFSHLLPLVSRKRKTTARTHYEYHYQPPKSSSPPREYHCELLNIKSPCYLQIWKGCTRNIPPVCRFESFPQVWRVRKRKGGFVPCQGVLVLLSFMINSWPSSKISLCHAKTFKTTPVASSNSGTA